MAYIGIKTRSTSAASDNLRRINDAIAAKIPITLPPDKFYINGLIKTGNHVGCARFMTDGTGGFSIDDHSSYNGPRTQIVQLANSPMLRIRGAGFHCEAPVEWIGYGMSQHIIEMEGSAAMATGRARFRHQLFRQGSIAIKCLAGYYNSAGTFIADENHADNSTVENCETMNVTTFFQSLNQQAVNWTFRDCLVSWTGGAAPETTVLDIVRGGSVTIDGLVVETPQTTLIQTTDFSPNQCWFDCRRIWIDRMLSAYYFKAFKYAGSLGSAGWSQWFVDVLGFSANYQAAEDYLDVPGTLPTVDFNINIRTRYGS